LKKKRKKRKLNKEFLKNQKKIRWNNHLNLKIIRLEYNLRKARMRMMEKKKNMKRWK
jgi:hypothetical protein